MKIAIITLTVLSIIINIIIFVFIIRSKNLSEANNEQPNKLPISYATGYGYGIKPVTGTDTRPIETKSNINTGCFLRKGKWTVFAYTHNEPFNVPFGLISMNDIQIEKHKFYKKNSLFFVEFTGTFNQCKSEIKNLVKKCSVNEVYTKKIDKKIDELLDTSILSK